MQGYQDKQFDDQRSLWPFVKRIFGYSLRYPRWFWGFISTVAIVAVADAVFPLIWLSFIDDLLVPAIEQYKASSQIEVDRNGLLRYALAYFIFTVISVVCVYAFIDFAGRIREYVMYDLRKAMFDKLQRLSFSFYDKSATGWLLSRITSDADRVTELISWGFLALVWGVIMIFAMGVAMFSYSWKLGLMVLGTIPVLAFLTYKIRQLILLYSRESRRLNSEITANFNEHINGIDVNKSTAQEEKAVGRFKGLSSSMQGASFRASYYTAMYVPLVVMTGSVAAGLVVYFGGSMSVAGGITLGTLAAFFQYSRSIFEPIFDITRFYALAQGSLSAGERIFSLIDEHEDIRQSADMPAYGEIGGDIEFRDCGFHYVPGKQILDGFNLRIRAGESVALVGPSGEGKSTIANLVCRFYEVQQGAVMIDGIDYRERSLYSLRSQLGVILQQPHLFSGSIADNIRFGNDEISDERIAEALRLLGADQFAQRMDMVVGEEGSQLSTGEKQVVSFARCLVRNPRILVLDEATSSIDAIAESRIQNGIDRMIRDRTSIIIAHRLSTIRNCDRILVIQKGRVVEEGTHAALMKRKGEYYRLYTNQLRKSLVA